VFVFRDIALLQKKMIVIFQENIISRRITTMTSVNGIFYMVVERVFSWKITIIFFCNNAMSLNTNTRLND
jgi:hypothetical protein